MNIAEHILTKCGGGSLSDGIRVVALWVDRHPKSVRCWTYPRARQGTDGVIPAKDQATILRAARAAGIDLTPADFFGLAELPPLGAPANDNAVGNVRPNGDPSHANPSGEVS